MHKQLVLSVRDLRFAAIHCPDCHTRVSLDLDIELEGRLSPFYAPRECPRCTKPYPATVPQAIEQIQRAYRALTAAHAAVTFDAGDAGEPDQK